MTIKTIVAAAALVLAPVASQAASYVGEFWDSNGGFSTIDQAMAFANGTATTGTFVSTTIDYPNGSVGSFSDNNTMSAFLGVDAASYTGITPSSLRTSVFRISGTFLPGAGLKTYTVGSDDGFALEINGTEISRYSRPRAFGYTSVDFDAGSSPVDFVLTYYENYGHTGLDFKIDGQTVTNAIAVSASPAPVPVPAALPLLAGAIGLLGYVRRRAKA